MISTFKCAQRKVGASADGAVGDADCCDGLAVGVTAKVGMQDEIMK